MSPDSSDRMSSMWLKKWPHRVRWFHESKSYFVCLLLNLYRPIFIHSASAKRAPDPQRFRPIGSPLYKARTSHLPLYACQEARALRIVTVLQSAVGPFPRLKSSDNAGKARVNEKEQGYDIYTRTAARIVNYGIHQFIFSLGCFALCCVWSPTSVNTRSILPTLISSGCVSLLGIAVLSGFQVLDLRGQLSVQGSLS